jgi:hypothetical protein
MKEINNTDVVEKALDQVVEPCVKVGGKLECFMTFLVIVVILITSFVFYFAVSLIGNGFKFEILPILNIVIPFFYIFSFLFSWIFFLMAKSDLNYIQSNNDLDHRQIATKEYNNQFQRMRFFLIITMVTCPGYMLVLFLTFLEFANIC